MAGVHGFVGGPAVPGPSAMLSAHTGPSKGSPGTPRRAAQPGRGHQLTSAAREEPSRVDGAVALPHAHVHPPSGGAEHRPPRHVGTAGEGDALEIAVREEQPGRGAQHHVPPTGHCPVEHHTTGMRRAHRCTRRHGHRDPAVSRTAGTCRHHERLDDGAGQRHGGRERETGKEQRDGHGHAAMCLTPCRRRQDARAAAARPWCGSG